MTLTIQFEMQVVALKTFNPTLYPISDEWWQFKKMFIVLWYGYGNHTYGQTQCSSNIDDILKLLTKSMLSLVSGEWKQIRHIEWWQFLPLK